MNKDNYTQNCQRNLIKNFRRCRKLRKFRIVSLQKLFMLRMKVPDIISRRSCFKLFFVLRIIFIFLRTYGIRLHIFNHTYFDY